MDTHPQGILLIDKPSGITSHDVVDAIRSKFNTSKVGHTGTLDPLATGLLVLLIGKQATTLSNVLKHDTKSYIITMALGYTSNELDIDGEITKKLDPGDPKLNIDDQIVLSTITAFVGSYDQEVPSFSAVKVNGKKLYEYARQGKLDQVVIPKRNVTVFSIEDIHIYRSDVYPVIQFKTHVSSGTYTRALVRDIGSKLGIPTIQTALRRIQVGAFSIDSAKTIEDISEHDIIPISSIGSSDEENKALSSSLA